MAAVLKVHGSVGRWDIGEMLEQVASMSPCPLAHTPSLQPATCSPTTR